MTNICVISRKSSFLLLFYLCSFNYRINKNAYTLFLLVVSQDEKDKGVMNNIQESKESKAAKKALLSNRDTSVRIAVINGKGLEIMDKVISKKKKRPKKIVSLDQFSVFFWSFFSFSFHKSTSLSLILFIFLKAFLGRGGSSDPYVNVSLTFWINNHVSLPLFLHLVDVFDLYIKTIFLSDIFLIFFIYFFYFFFFKRYIIDHKEEMLFFLTK